MELDHVLILSGVIRISYRAMQIGIFSHKNDCSWSKLCVPVIKYTITLLFVRVLLYKSTDQTIVFSFFSFHSDTFASKVAAIQDQYADASIGNVTGSNAVNVFLGIGVSH